MFRLPEPDITWAGDKLLSTRFDDVYFQGKTAAAETQHVFIDGLEGPGEERWLTQHKRARLLEVGFGTGSNFLVFLDHWQRHAAPDARLVYAGIEAFPALHLLAQRELSGAERFREELLGQAPPPLKGVHTLSFLGGRVMLRLLYGEAAFWATRLTGKFDAVLLDGFTPAKNPELWSPELIQRLTDHVEPGGRLATFTVARPVKDALSAAGWQLEKRPGFGRKRECLVAKLPGSTHKRLPEPIQVNGAGVAGCLVHREALARGLDATLCDPNGVGSGASGNALALVDPRFSLDDGALGRLRLGAIQYAEHYYERRQLWRRRGVHMRPSKALTEQRMQKLAKLGLPDEWLHFSAGALYAYLGGSLVPQGVLGTPPLSPRDPQRLQINCLGWQDPLCRPNRGQITIFEESEPWAPVCKEGYAATVGPGRLIAGASYQRFDREVVPSDFQPRNADDEGNRTKASAALSKSVDGGVLDRRVSMRGTTPDHLPILGSSVLTGLGSRGFTFAPILADALVSMLLDEPGPLDAEILGLLQPDRHQARPVVPK